SMKHDSFSVSVRTASCLKPLWERMPKKKFQGPPPIPIRELPQPELSEEEANARYESTKRKPTPYLSADGLRLVEESEHGTLDGETKYVLLRRVIPLHVTKIWADLLRPLKYRD